jgi:hypothetical protein
MENVMTIEREKFLARLAEARQAGLVDIKFCFQPSKAMKPDEIFAALNHVEVAVKTGHRHASWDGNVPA